MTLSQRGTLSGFQVKIYSFTGSDYSKMKQYRTVHEPCECEEVSLKGLHIEDR